MGRHDRRISWYSAGPVNITLADYQNDSAGSSCWTCSFELQRFATRPLTAFPPAFPAFPACKSWPSPFSEDREESPRDIQILLAAAPPTVRLHRSQPPIAQLVTGPTQNSGTWCGSATLSSLITPCRPQLRLLARLPLLLLRESPVLTIPSSSRTATPTAEGTSRPA